MATLLEIDLLQVITTGRLWSIVAGLLGLASVVIGRLAMSSSARRINSGRRRSIVALTLGLISILLSTLHLASTTGGFGTGKGRAGAIVALVIGLTGTIFGYLGFARSRRMVADNNNAAPVTQKGKA